MRCYYRNGSWKCKEGNMTMYRTYFSLVRLFNFVLMAKTLNFKETLNYFCESTTIHGFYQLRHSNNLMVRLLWGCVLLAMFSCTIWLSAVSIQKYVRFDIKTTETYTTDYNFEFPTITFCNQFPGLHSFLATNPLILQLFVTFLTDKPDDLQQAFKESTKVCKSNKHSLYENETMNDLINMSLNDIQRLFSLDSFRSIIKCWWAMKEFDCSGSFANHFTDRATCFSYYPNKMTAQYTFHPDLRSMTYGLNESINDRIVRSGAKSGLQLLLNVHQDEHCEASRKYEGAGFQVIVHDPLNPVPMYSMSSHINLLPGYSQTIVLKPTVFTRKTDHLGFCKKSIYKFLGTEVYFKDLCIQFCFIKRAVVVCNCAAKKFFPTIEAALQQLDNFDIHSKRDCTAADFICLKNQQIATYMSESFQTNCPECIQPCYETNYEFLVTKQKLSNRSLGNYFQFLPNQTNRSEIRKNFLLVNFIFDSLTVVRVVETQEFTIYDLLIYFGGVIGLFLGMSFMSIGDIPQFSFLNISRMLKNVYPLMKETNRVVLKWIRNRMKKKTKVVQMKVNR